MSSFALGVRDDAPKIVPASPCDLEWEDTLVDACMLARNRVLLVLGAHDDGTARDYIDMCKRLFARLRGAQGIALLSVSCADDAVCEPLAVFLAGDAHIKTLILRGPQVSASVLDAVGTMCSLKSLSIREFRLGRVGVRCLKAITQVPDFESLILSDCCLNGLGRAELNVFREALSGPDRPVRRVYGGPWPSAVVCIEPKPSRDLLSVYEDILTSGRLKVMRISLQGVGEKTARKFCKDLVNKGYALPPTVGIVLSDTERGAYKYACRLLMHSALMVSKLLLYQCGGTTREQSLLYHRAVMKSTTVLHYGANASSMWNEEEVAQAEEHLSRHR